MEEKKLTDEEIIKELENLAVIDLIHRLQSENKSLKTDLENECEEHKQFIKLAKKIDEEQKTEIERLTEELDFYKGANRELTSTNEMLKGYRKQVDELEKENKFENKTWCNMIEDCPMAQQAVKDTAKEILQGFMKWLNQAISNSYEKSVKGSVRYGGMNTAFHEVKDLVKKVAESKGVEVE